METAKNIIYPWRWIAWLSGKKNRKSPTPEEKLELKLRPYENYLYKFQELLLWKKPYETVLFLASLQCVFIFLAFTKLRFFCVICWSALALVLLELWIYKIWPFIRVEQPEPQDSNTSTSAEHTPEGMLSVPELSKFVTCIQSFAISSFSYLKTLRATHPSTFCGVMVSSLLFMIQVGSAVSGFWLLYGLVMFSVLSPGVIFRLMTPESRERLAAVFTKIALFIHPKESDSTVEDYLPEQSKENLSLFNLASGENVKTNVSTPSSDMDVLPLEPIPSFDESSLDHDFSLTLNESALDSASRMDDSTLSFRPTHFNGSTLSVALKKALADTLGSHLVSPTSAPLIEENSDSDSSEFELIEPDNGSNPT